MFRQKGGRPLVGKLGCLLIIMRPADAGESVIAARIGIDDGAVDLRQRIADLLLGLGRYELVLLRDMSEIGFRYGVCFVQVLFYADAVVGDGAIRAGAGRHQICQLAAQAIAEGADGAGATFKSPKQMQGGDQVIDALDLAEAFVQLERLRPFGIGFVGDLDAGFLAPEQIRAKGEISL